MQEVLDECRKNFGEVPRKFGFADRCGYLKLEKLFFLVHRDKHILPFLQQKNMLRKGVLTFGHVVQTNRGMYDFGTENLWGVVVYPTNGASDVNALRGVAESLRALKGTRPSEPQEAEIAGWMTDEVTVFYGVPIPHSLKPPFPCAMSVVYYARHHLPNGKLSLRHFPLLINPREPKTVMVLPSRYWPKSFVELWENAGLIF